MTDDLAAWLLEQIAEDERIATNDGRVQAAEWTALATGPESDWSAPWEVLRVGGVAFRAIDHEARHAANWDPMRVLAECDAKRRIVERHVPHELPLGPICDYCSHVPEAVEWPCPDLRDAISVFADPSRLPRGVEAMTLPPEPPIGAEVVDRHDVRWVHVEGTYGGRCWLHADTPDGDPESWTRVNEFAPLRLAWITASMQGGEPQEELRPLTWVDPEDWSARVPDR